MIKSSNPPSSASGTFSRQREKGIFTKQLTLGYSNKTIISNINLQIADGEFIGILGPNGSGKSTFLRTILGLQQPLSGKLSVIDNSRIGYMPQLRSHIGLSNLTGRALLEVTISGLGFGPPLLSHAHKKEIQHLLEMVGAVAIADRPFQQLSGGERQRIYLAQALLGQPQILLLDEPLSNLDPKFQEVFISLLKHIQDQTAVTILMTAHDPNPMLAIMSRVLFFANGKAAIGKVDEIISSQTLSDLYGTPIEVVRLKNRIFVLSDSAQNVLGEVHHHD